MSHLNDENTDVNGPRWAAVLLIAAESPRGGASARPGAVQVLQVPLAQRPRRLHAAAAGCCHIISSTWRTDSRPQWRAPPINICTNTCRRALLLIASRLIIISAALGDDATTVHVYVRVSRLQIRSPRCINRWEPERCAAAVWRHALAHNRRRLLYRNRRWMN